MVGRGKGTAVHPHACGESVRGVIAVLSKFGSSPRVWGKPVQDDQRNIQSWFIPTRVGKAPSWKFMGSSSTVHPHACGESAVISIMAAWYPGSSPRVWGKRRRPRHPQPRPRFIPTRVGKAAARWNLRRTPLVHPHACGESLLAFADYMSISGSSPRVWGKLNHQRLEAQCVRFIPTRVGKAAHISVALVHRAVHPHACGESQHPLPGSHRSSGSSPRVWGKLRRLWSGHAHPRFIPTRVGKAISCSGPERTASVHPHACGESEEQIRDLKAGCGSSPRVWGKLPPPEQLHRIDRFIPTRVGKARTRPPFHPGSPVHPHACGESRRRVTLYRFHSGSSPRVWGKREESKNGNHRMRFIPTRVGKA
mgnify:CR=1 FL=1